IEDGTDFTWRLRISNGVILKQNEPEQFHENPEAMDFLGLPPGFDLVGHTVRVDTGRLSVSLEFERDTGVTIESARVVVQRRGEDLDAAWPRVPKEEARLEGALAIAPNRRRVSLEVPLPHTDLRYSIAYWPAPRGGSLPPAGVDFAKALLE